jgi:phosphoenolpyruvate-protein kinase (PTS system EI component)
VTCAEDVEQVRAFVGAKIPLGAMIETPEAVAQSEEICAAADFICIGTNDLFARVTGQAQPRSSLAMDARVLHMIARVVAVAHRHGRKVSVCGEMAGEPHGARILVGLGVDRLSVAPGRFARLKLSFRDVTIGDCQQVASEALK